jgi:selenide,water dikinase
VRTIPELRRDLVLVGGGHAHALALRMLAMRPVAGVRTTLISPASHTPYSGMLPGLLAGHYSFEQTHIDLARLCQWAGVRFLAAEVTALDPAARSLTLAGRPAVGYDLLSIDIGSCPELDSVPGARAHAVPVKPVAGLWRRWSALRQRLEARAGGGALRVAVVGGGAGGVELAMAIAHRLAGTPVGIDLWCAGPEILEGYNRRSRAAVVAALARQRVSVHTGCRVVGVEPRSLLLADGTRAVFDELFWCTGASAAPWIAGSGLHTDQAGFLAVRDTLQSLGDERVFGSGDIAIQVNHPRPRAGVFAVRQGPVLACNLRAALLLQPLREHRPQRRFLSLVSLGEKRAVADRGLFSASGRWVWRWKDRIDRAFMDRFKTLPSPMRSAPPAELPSPGEAAAGPPPAGELQRPCGGCGAKIAADTLGAVLAELGRDYPAHCLQASEADDAAPVPVTGTGPVLQSLDMLRELVADPWLMGRIAANHALSDLHACGVRPRSALAAVTLPFASAPLLQRELKQILAGALQAFSAVGCSLAGGHSMQGAELSVGFVVNGQPISGEDRLLRKRGLVPGDRLILTGPLGTGTLFAAHMQLRADGRDIAAAIDAMLASNGPAAELALAHGVQAATDVTGFGLLGHLLEMLGEACGACLDLGRLPLLPGALEHVAAGTVSTLHAENARARWALERAGPLEEARLQLLFDPQTSGPLLLGAPGETAAKLLQALRGRGCERAAVIGEVFAREPGTGGGRVICRQGGSPGSG